MLSDGRTTSSRRSSLAELCVLRVCAKRHCKRPTHLVGVSQKNSPSVRQIAATFTSFESAVYYYLPLGILYVAKIEIFTTVRVQCVSVIY